MYRDVKEKKKISGWLKIIIFLLIVVSVYFSRKYYIAYQHPYRGLDIIGTWDYAYSVAFDVDKKLVRTDKDLFSLEMYTETEIELNDDGSFRLSIEGVEFTGSWVPDTKATNVFHLSPETPNTVFIVYENEIRWDKDEDRICVGLSKNYVPKELNDLFNDDEMFRYIFCKTYRNNTQTVYVERDSHEEEDEWDYDNGLPFNYHP